jgi:peroxiredoxin
MEERMQPLQPGEPAPAFDLDAANRAETVSLAGLRGRPFLIGFLRGLHCPFCRRQVRQLAGVQPALQAAGIETLAVINTPVERARLYFRYQPTPVTLLCDPDCRSHRAFGVPHVAFLPPESRDEPQWPARARAEDFKAARINPGGELPAALQPMAANAALNMADGFEPDASDEAMFARHGTQLVGHFLVDADGIVRWVEIEARDGPNGIGTLPGATQILAAASRLGHPPSAR